MKINKNFFFGCSVYAVLFWFWVFFSSKETSPPFWVISIAFFFCQPLRIGKNVFSLFGGENKKGNVISIISFWQSANGNAFALVAFWQTAGKNALAIICIGQQKALKEVAFSAVLLGIQSAFMSSAQLCGIAYQKATECKCAQGFGVSIQSGVKVDHFIGITFQNATEVAYCFIGIRPFVRAERVRRASPFVMDIAIPKKLAVA